MGTMKDVIEMLLEEKGEVTTESVAVARGNGRSKSYRVYAGKVLREMWEAGEIGRADFGAEGLVYYRLQGNAEEENEEAASPSPGALSSPTPKPEELGRALVSMVNGYEGRIESLREQLNEEIERNAELSRNIRTLQERVAELNKRLQEGCHTIPLWRLQELAKGGGEGNGVH